MSIQINALDILEAANEAAQLGEPCELDRFEPCDLLPVGADVAYFPEAGVVMIATNSNADHYEICGPWQGTTDAVVALLGGEA